MGCGFWVSGSVLRGGCTALHRAVEVAEWMEGREVAAVGVFGQQQHDAARQWEALAAQYSSRLPVAICRSDGVLQQCTGPQGGSAPLLLVKGPGVMEWAVWRGSMERAEHWLDQQLRGQLPAVTEAILSSSV